MQEVNVAILSGNVGEVFFASTERRGDPAANFTLFVDKDDQQTTLVRVNVFGELVRHCQDLGLKQGNFVIVEGELMNRTLRSHKNFRNLEVRANDIKILSDVASITHTRISTKEEGVALL